MTKKTTAELADDALNMVEAVRGYGNKGKKRATTALYWRIGKLINDATGGKWVSEKGKKAINTVSKELKSEYGDEFTTPAIRRMVKFSDRFDYETVVTLSSKLDWNHFDELIEIDDDLKRDFYAWMCMAKEWKVPKLQSQIKSSLYEKTPITYRATDSDADFAEGFANADPKIMAFFGLEDNGS